MRIKLHQLGFYPAAPVMDPMPSMGPAGPGGAAPGAMPLAPSGGASFTNISSGIASILTPLLSAGAGILAAQQQMKFEKQMMRNQPAMPSGPPMIIQQGGLSTGVIIAIAAGVLLLVGMVMMMSRGGGGGSGMGGSYAGPTIAGVSAGTGGGGSAPQVRVVRRVKRKSKPNRKRK